MKRVISEKSKANGSINKSPRRTPSTKKTPTIKPSVEATRTTTRVLGINGIEKLSKRAGTPASPAPHAGAPRPSAIGSNIIVDKALSTTCSSEGRAKVVYIRKNETIAERTLNLAITISVFAFVLWAISSIAFRATAIRYSNRAQKEAWEISALNTEITALEASIMDLKNRQRLVEYAEEKGMEYVWERIKIIDGTDLPEKQR